MIASRLERVELGEDREGAPISSCVIVPVAMSATTKKPVRVTGAAKVALDILKRAICDTGEIPPACNHIPANVRAVKIDLWRRYCYLGAVARSDATQDAKLKAFVRASERLQAAGAIGSWEEWVWPA